EFRGICRPRAPPEIDGAFSFGVLSHLRPTGMEIDMEPKQAVLAPNAVGPPFPRLNLSLSPRRVLARFGDFLTRPRDETLSGLSNHLLRDLGLARDQLDLLRETGWTPRQRD